MGPQRGCEEGKKSSDSAESYSETGLPQEI